MHVICSGQVNSINLERCKACVLELNSTLSYPEIISSAVVDLRVVQSGQENAISNITSVSKTKIIADNLNVTHINQI